MVSTLFAVGKVTSPPEAHLIRWTMSAPKPEELQELLRACASADDVFTKTNISTLNKPPLLELAKAAIAIAFDYANSGSASSSRAAAAAATPATEDPAVIAAAGFMYCVEFFADKTPGVDSGWDALHTFIRIPAGAMLAAGAVGDVSPAMAVAAGLVGGTVTAATHTTKAGGRVLINHLNFPASLYKAPGCAGAGQSGTDDNGVFLMSRWKRGC